MTTLQVLEQARSILQARGWCQRAAARNARGRAVDPRAKAAQSVCLPTAIALVAGTKPAAERARKLLRQVTGAPVLFAWNDAAGRTAAEVDAALGDAIRLAKGGRP